MSDLLNKSGLLRALVPGRPQHHELAAGNGGATLFDGASGKVLELHTPPDPLIRVHEIMHTKHTDPDIRFGQHEFAQQIIEDIRLHMNHWPWPRGATPKLIADAGVAQLTGEIEKINAALTAADAAKLTRDKRGQGFGLALRNAVAIGAINGTSAMHNFPNCFSRIEIGLAISVIDAMRDGKFELAATLYESAFFDAPPEKEKSEGEESESEGEDKETEAERRKREAAEKAKAKRVAKKKKEMGALSGTPKPTVCVIDDNGPYTDPCGDPQEAWTLATSGSRIHRPSLRRPILPQRMFMRRRPSMPGGAIIIDASGSMGLTSEQIIQIIDATPMATVALYSGNDNGMAPRGIIYVVSKDGFRRSRDQLEDWIERRQRGNSVDLEAINWLLEQGTPRTFVTDREFCGSVYSRSARAKLDNCEAAGDMTVILNTRAMETLVPGTAPRPRLRARP